MALALLLIRSPGSGQPPFTGSSPKSTERLAQVVSRYNSGDMSPEIEQILQGVKRSDDRAERGKANYYLGRYYHRAYELNADRNGLTKASASYKACMDTFQGAGGEWLSDARFYKALQYLQRGDIRHAKQALDEMDPGRDTEIYVDHITWTGTGEYAIYRKYGASDLKQFLMEKRLDRLSQQPLGLLPRIYRADRVSGPGISDRFKRVVAEIARWCRIQSVKETPLPPSARC